jgi:hypothetical protein
VDIPLERFGIVKASDKNHFFPKILERLKHLAKFHVGALSFGPPLVSMETAASKKNRHASWWLTRLSGITIDISPYSE